MFVFMIFYFSQDRSTGFRPSFNLQLRPQPFSIHPNSCHLKNIPIYLSYRFLNVWNCFMFFINVGTKGHHAKQLWIHQRRSRIDTGWLWLPALAPMSFPDTLSQSLCPRGAKKLGSHRQHCIRMPSKAMCYRIIWQSSKVRRNEI